MLSAAVLGWRSIVGCARVGDARGCASVNAVELPPRWERSTWSSAVKIAIALPFAGAEAEEGTGLGQCMGGLQCILSEEPGARVAVWSWEGDRVLRGFYIATSSRWRGQRHALVV